MPAITLPAPRLAALCLSLALLGTASVALAAPATQEATKTVSARKAALTKEKHTAGSTTGSKKTRQNKAAQASRSTQAATNSAMTTARTGASRGHAAGKAARTQPVPKAASKAAGTAAAAAASAVAAPSGPQPVPGNYAEHLDVKAFVSEMAERHGFDRDALLALFAQVSPNARTLALMAPPPPPPPVPAPAGDATPAGAAPTTPPPAPKLPDWQTYRARFLQPVRIDGGLKFWEQHAGALERATQEHGVPAEIIVAIIGVETLYGRNTGKFPTIQALSTLAFDFPPRAAYFRKELEQFLLYCRENGLDPLTPRGSYAGAIGTPQFMPGSIRSYATDFDGDGRIDLVNSPVDAIGSVARFLAIHGWQKDRDLYYPATLAENADPASLLARGPKPELSIADLRAAGIASPLSLPADQPLMLVDLPNGANPPSYVIGTGNFYAITRYNRSFFYAMAVTELAEVLHQRHAGTLGAPQLELPNQPTLPQKTPSP
mgnify:FL=1